MVYSHVAARHGIRNTLLGGLQRCRKRVITQYGNASTANIYAGEGSMRPPASKQFLNVLDKVSNKLSSNIKGNSCS